VKKDVRPVIVTKEEKKNHINLLAFNNSFNYDNQDDETKFAKCEKNYHITTITDFSRLMHGINKHKEPTHWCQTCLNHFSSKKVLKAHKLLNCQELGKGRIQLPPTGDESICRHRNTKASFF
jgi:ribonuclease HIII